MTTSISECPVCPPWVECAHLGEWCVRLSSIQAWDKHLHFCNLPAGRDGRSGVAGPAHLGPLVTSSCSGWNGKRELDTKSMYYGDERAAREEFDARCEAMRALADAEP